MNQSERANLTYWDELAEWHYQVYNLQPLREGKPVLDEITLHEVGNVRGKSVLHLHCHIGSDSLSWALLGAEVTGVDFSAKALDVASTLTIECNQKARWIQSEIGELPSKLEERFDIVFATQGIFSWVSDLKAWMKTAAHFVKPGGMLYLQDCHPFMGMINLNDANYPIVNSYFHRSEPDRWEAEPESVDPKPRPAHHHFEWQWSLGDIVTAVINAGLRIEFLHEFGKLFYQDAPFLIPDENGWWFHPKFGEGVPMSFSVMAIKD